ncbi:MAG: FAD-binding protein [Candidatus Dormibacteraeota bacterium]|nr:FAD-binding protein [Candidatus Dormibacteraeota bacterium]
MSTLSDGTWRNWGRNQSCTPVALPQPSSEEEIIALVRRASEEGRRVKVYGAGHSFTDIACTDGYLLNLDRYNRVLEVDRESNRVRVQAGISIASLGEELARHGMAQPNLGDIAYQSIAGAVSTATHGTGLGLGNIATQLCEMTMILADGRVLDLSPERDLDAFRCAQVSLGALGIISTVTLQCVPRFVLRSVEDPRPLDEVLDRYAQMCESNQHFEFFWFPHTDRVQAIWNNPVEAPPAPRGRGSAWVDDILLENHLFGLVQRAGRWRNQWIPSLNRFATSVLSHAETTDWSHRVFANPRLVRFVEMEYAIPRRHAVEAIRELRAMIDHSDMRISFPVEVRVGAGDDAVLSTAHGRETTYIAVHVFEGMPYERYFREVETIMNGFEGRPHWGKMHYQAAATLRTRYPRFDDFVALRNQLDPSGRFSNRYLDRVLGPV